ncbi:MAG: hypothetical protein IKR12_00800 [Clostridia bacterium]|nr:hypothetical protein [Clostridia bacterium]
MVAISTIYSNAHKYLKTEEMRKEFEAFKEKYNVDCFEQAQALINMAISGKMSNPQLLKNLKEYYNDEDPAFRNIVDKCFNHLVKTYGKEDIQLRDGRVVNGAKYLLNAKKSLSNQKTKAEENTL